MNSDEVCCEVGQVDCFAGLGEDKRTQLGIHGGDAEIDSMECARLDVKESAVNRAAEETGLGRDWEKRHRIKGEIPSGGEERMGEMEKVCRDRNRESEGVEGESVVCIDDE